MFESDNIESCSDNIESDNIESCSDNIETDSPKESKHVRTVTYSTQIIDTKHSDWRKQITHEQIDKYNFDKHFIEILDNPIYVRPYFDFDEIETADQYVAVLRWLNDLRDNKHWGNYAIGGYTAIKDLSDKCDYYKRSGSCDLKYIENAHHKISIHVVFFERVIEARLLIKLMKCKDKQFVYKAINSFCDPNVYKLNTRQLMRHPLSDKYFKRNSEMNKTTAGSILMGASPSDLIVTPNGTEQEISELNLFESFGFDEPDSDEEEAFKAMEALTKTKKATEQNKSKRSHHKQQQTIEDIEYVDGLIKFDKDQLIEFIERLGIENNTNGILVQLAPLYSSPFDKSFLIETIDEWYQKEEHDHPENVSNFIDRYYKNEQSNRWFFSLLKKYGTDEIRAEYKPIHKDHIDMSININNTELSFDDVKDRKYSINNVPKLLNDLRAVIGNIDDKWYLKIVKNDQRFIISCTDDQIRAKTKTTKPFSMNTKISIYQIISKYSDIFRYKTATIQKDNSDDKNINLFQGFKYQEIDTDNFELIQPFLDHIKSIICQNSEEKYNYFLCWWSNIIQNITVKNCSMPIIFGGQGSGKSFVVETLCELFGNYALCNVDDLDKVFGKFNGLIGRNLVININEPPEAGEKFSFNGKIKSKLTQKKIVQETKGIDQIEIDSYANYILTTNSYCPIKEEKGDRRLIYFETDNSKCGDEEYFNNLCKVAQPTKQGEYNSEFMGILLHYFLTQVDVSDFNSERLIRQINSRTDIEYNEQLERQYADCSAIDRYVIDHYKDFVNGIDTDYIRTNMNRLPTHTVNSVSRALNTICNKKRIRKNGKQIMVYQLKPKEQIQDLYNIINYREFNGLIEEEKKENDLASVIDTI